MSLATSALALLVALMAAAGVEPRLIDAVKTGNRDAVRTLLKSADVNAPEVDGTTALHWSVRGNDLETTRLLLGAGAWTRPTGTASPRCPSPRSTGTPP